MCDGKSIFEYKPAQKQVEEHRLPRELQGKAIANSPLPFLFGAEAQKLKQRYFIRIVTPQDVQDQIWLEAYPRFQQDAANFHHAQFVITTRGMSPFALMLVDQNVAEQPGAGPHELSVLRHRRERSLGAIPQRPVRAVHAAGLAVHPRSHARRAARAGPASAFRPAAIGRRHSGAAKYLACAGTRPRFFAALRMTIAEEECRVRETHQPSLRCVSRTLRRPARCPCPSPLPKGEGTFPRSAHGPRTPAARRRSLPMPRQVSGRSGRRRGAVAPSLAARRDRRSARRPTGARRSTADRKPRGRWPSVDPRQTAPAASRAASSVSSAVRMRVSCWTTSSGGGPSASSAGRRGAAAACRRFGRASRRICQAQAPISSIISTQPTAKTDGQRRSRQPKPNDQPRGRQRRYRRDRPIGPHGPTSGRPMRPTGADRCRRRGRRNASRQKRAGVQWMHQRTGHAAQRIAAAAAINSPSTTAATPRGRTPVLDIASRCHTVARSCFSIPSPPSAFCYAMRLKHNLQYRVRTARARAHG